MDFKPEIIDRLKKLEEKYAGMGQDLGSYLDGLLYSNVTTYWDYTKVDTLLTLQNPKTDFPDEMIFIVYHQITELYFKLALHELEQLANNGRNVLISGEDKGWNEKLDVNLMKDKPETDGPGLKFNPHATLFETFGLAGTVALSYIVEMPTHLPLEAPSAQVNRC